MTPDYARAERFLPWHLRRQVRNAAPRPAWTGDGERFWYRRQHADGWVFLSVDAETGERAPAFDHARLAQALAAATGRVADPTRLDLGGLRPDGAAVEFVAYGTRWRFEDADGSCRALGPAPLPHELTSPDGRHVAFVRGHDLWVRDAATGAERPLSTDGTPGWAYAKSPDANLMVISHRRAGIVLPPAALWSPNSRRILTHVMDEREVAETYLVQSVPPGCGHRPVLHRWRVALVGDAHLALAHHVVFDLDTGAAVFAQHQPRASQNASPVERGNAWWGSDGTVFFLHADRGDRVVQLCAMDAASGAVTVLIEEEGENFIELNHATGNYPNVRVIDGGREIIWFSQRDGWSHLYRYDGAGRLLGRITGGEWVVHDILHVDETARTLVFTASGTDGDPDPYVRKIYRIGLDGTGMTPLTPAALDHEVIVRRPILPNVYDPVASHDPATGVSPSGRHFVVTASRVDRMPVTHLLRRDGSQVAVLETAEMTPELAADWRWPRPFVVKGRDGVTDIHGALWLPADFDPGHRYPILDMIYPGPQRIQTPKAAFPGDAGRFALYAWARAYAELGIAVVTLDGMGTPYRSKAFHDVCVGNMGDAGGLADHVAGLRELAREAPYLDTGRVGIIGHSGGGFAAARALLAFPEFFTVGIASAGNHDQRGYSAAWGERYQGLLEPRDGGDNFDQQANAALAGALRGKLMLATGEMDENVHLCHTMRLADALIAHNKDFELVVVPNANHATLVSHPWFVRKRFDFLVRHLLGAEPPAEYRFTPAGP